MNILEKMKIKSIENLLKKIDKFKTAKDLIETLDIDFEDKINEVSKQGFIYERLWDICIKFGLVKKIIKFDDNNKLRHYVQNANELYINDFKEFNEIFDDYLTKNFQSGKGGGYSDITFKNDEEVVISSCKYFADDDKQDIKNYEIQNLCPIIDANKSINFKIILFVKDKNKFLKKRKTDNKSSNILIKYIKSNGKYENIYDLNDLEIYFKELKIILEYFNYLKTKEDLDKFKKEYLKKFKRVFKPKFHQCLYINQISKIIKKKDKSNKNILIGAVPRTGKTFILGGIIKNFIENFKRPSYNFLILTPAPTETIPQYKELFENYLDFNNLSINKYDNKNNNIFLFSKQKLDKKDDDIMKILKKIKFDIIFIDEAHQGMTTDKSKDLLINIKDIDTYKIFITATYNKPINEFDIPENHRIIWNLENVLELKRIANNYNEKDFNNFIKRLKDAKKFDNKIIDDVLKDFSIYNILQQYKNYPEPCLITTIWNNVDSIYKELELADNDLDNYTFNMDTLFNITKNNFDNEEQLIELFHYFLGYSRKGIDYKLRKKYEQIGIIPRINSICNNNCRTLQNSSLTSQLWFLPTNNNKLVNKIPILLELLNKHFPLFFNQTFFLIAISDTKIKEKDIIHNNIKIVKEKEEIFSCENECRLKYNNLVILTGEKFKLGVSLPNVDIVVLFNNSMSADNIYQMMFRSMTEIDEDYQCIPNEYCPKKKYGFIVDLNPQRTIAITDYIGQLLDKKDKNKEERQYKVLDLLNIDRDFYKSNFYDNDDDETKKEYSKQFFNKLVEIYDGKASNIYKELNEFIFDIDLDFLKDIKYILKKINFKHVIYKQGIDDVKFKNKILEYIKDKNIKEDEEEIINDVMIIKGILSELIPLLSFINGFDTYCIFNKINKFNKIELKDNLKNISNNEDLKEIFMEYMNDRFNLFELFDDYLSFFLKLIDNIDLKKEIMEKKKGGSGEIVQRMETIMERIQTKMYNIKDDPIKLINYINSFLKPTEKKKKENGEVFTPIKLVQEMIGKLKDAEPKIFTNPNLKWLDPASGMGNFPVVVYMELMKGLKNWEPNIEKRRKWILEEMLYMVEYDKTNVFMMRKIFCGNKYKLNIFHGSFIDGERYIKEGIDIFGLDLKDIKKDDNKNFIKKINKFNGKFDVIMGNPPYNSGGISSKKKDIDEDDNKRETIWTLFIENAFKHLKDKTGYLLFINPLYWLKLKPTHKLHEINIHNLLLEKHIIWLLLWDVNISKFKINGEIPLSLFLLQNIKNTKNLKTNINCNYNRIKYEINNNYYYLDNTLSIPLGFFSSLLKLQKYVKENNLKLDYKTTGIKKEYLLKHYKHDAKKDKLPKSYKLEDNYCVDTFTLNDGIKVNKSTEKHIDADKTKLIIANKSSLKGLFIDDGRLGICGNFNIYILGKINYLNFIKKLLNFKLIIIASLFSKFRQNLLDKDVFLYIPDLTKLGYKNITEDKLYKLIGLSLNEIKEIKDFKIKNYDD